MGLLAERLERATLALLRRPAPVLALLAGLSIFAGLGIFGLRVELSAVALFADDDLEVQNLDRLYEHWGPDDRELLILAEIGPIEASVLSPRSLDQLARLGRRLRGDPAVAAVVGLPDLPAADGQSTLLEALEQQRRETRRELGELERAGLFVPALDLDLTVIDPPTVPGFVSADGKSALTIATLDIDGDDLLSLGQHLARIRAEVDHCSATGPLTLTLAGIPAVRAASLDALIADQLRLVPLALGLAVLLLAVFFRSLVGVLVPLAAALWPTFFLLGFMGFVGQPIGMLNQVYTSLLPCLAMADAIHILCRYRALRPSFEDRHLAIARAVALSGRACLATSLTTAFGFLSLLVAPMPILRDFGSMAALGMVIAGLAVVVLVPLMLAHAPEATNRTRETGAADLLDRAIRLCARWAERQRAPIFGVFGLLAIAAAMAASGLISDTRLGSLLPSGDPTIAAQDTIDRRLGGTLPLHVDLEGPAGFFRRPDVIRALDRLESELATIDGVRSTIGPGSYLRILHELAAARGRANAETELPTTRRQLVALLIMGRSFERQHRRASGTDSQHGDTVFSDDSTRARLILRLADEGGRAHLLTARRIETRVESALAELDALAGSGIGAVHTPGAAEAVSPVEARLTGISYLAYRGSDSLTRELGLSLLLAFFLVTGVLIRIAGSWKVGLLGMAQNALPLLTAAGLMALSDWPLEPTSAVIFTLGLAIAVDDTLHVLCHYREHPEGGGREAILGSGRGLFATTAILGSAFLVLGTASFPALRIFGVLGAVVLLVALLVDLLLVPAALPSRVRKGLYDEPAENPEPRTEGAIGYLGS